VAAPDPYARVWETNIREGHVVPYPVMPGEQFHVYPIVGSKRGWPYEPSVTGTREQRSDERGVVFHPTTAGYDWR
jgi:hypothetical protein